MPTKLATNPAPITLNHARKILHDHGDQAVMNHPMVRRADGSWRPIVVHYQPGDIAFIFHLQYLPEPRNTWPYTLDAWGSRAGRDFTLGVVMGNLKDYDDVFPVLLDNSLMGFARSDRMRKAERSYSGWLNKGLVMQGEKYAQSVNQLPPVIENL